MMMKGCLRFFGLVLLAGVVLLIVIVANSKPRVSPVPAPPVSALAVASKPAEPKAVPAPTEEELAGDVVKGLSLGKRREIYSDFMNVLLDANLKAMRVGGDTNTEGTEGLLASIKKAHPAILKAGRRKMVAKWKVDGDTLDAIHKEGDAKEWPVR